MLELRSLVSSGPCAGDSPAVLRRKMLESPLAAAGVVSGDERLAAHALMEVLKRAVVTRPAISFADVVAKVRTCDAITRDRIGDGVDADRKELLQRALAEWARLRSPT